MELPQEIWNEIFKEGGNYKRVLVCKLWYDIIIKNCKICDKYIVWPGCGKIIKMYGIELWTTDIHGLGFRDPGKFRCHTFRGTITEYDKMYEPINKTMNLFIRRKN